MAGEFKIKTGLILGSSPTQPVTSITDSSSFSATDSSTLATVKAIKGYTDSAIRTVPSFAYVDGSLASNASLGNLTASSIVYNTSIGVLTSRQNITETSLGVISASLNDTVDGLSLFYTKTQIDASFATNASVNLAFYTNVSMGNLSAASAVYNTSIGVLTSRHNVTETSLGSITSYVSTAFRDGDAVMNTNPFGGRPLYYSQINNAMFRAESRWIVNGSIYSASTNIALGTLNENIIAQWFDGDYEDGFTIDPGQYAIVDIDFGTEPGGTYPSYPYGFIYFSHYYYNYSASIGLQVYCNYVPQGVGWKDIVVSTYYDNGGTALISRGYNSYYAISKMRFSVWAPDTSAGAASGVTKITEIDWKLDRPSSNEMPFVDKYKPNTLYSTLYLEDGNYNRVMELNQNAGGYLQMYNGILAGIKTPVSSSEGANKYYVDNALAINPSIAFSALIPVLNTSVGIITSRTNFTETSLYTLTGRHNVTETSVGNLTTLVSAINTSMGAGFGAYATNASVNTALTNYATNSSVNLALYANVSLGNLSVASTVYNTSIGVITSRHNFTETSLYTLTIRHNTTETSLGITTTLTYATNSSMGVGFGPYASNASVNTALTNYATNASVNLSYYSNVSLGNLSVASTVYNTSIGVLTSRHNLTETSLYTLTTRHNTTETSLGITTSLVSALNTSMGAGFGAYSTNASVNTALTNYTTNASASLAFYSNASLGLAFNQYSNASLGLAFNVYANVSLGNLSVASVTYNTSIGVLTSRHNITETSLGLTSSLVSALNTSMGSGFGAYATNASVNTALGNYATNASVNAGMSAAFASNASMGNLTNKMIVDNTSIGNLTSFVSVLNTSMGSGFGAYATNSSVNTALGNYATNTSVNTGLAAAFASNVSMGNLTNKMIVDNTSIGNLTSFVSVLNTSMGSGLGAYSTNASVNTALTNYTTNASASLAFYSNASLGLAFNQYANVSLGFAHNQFADASVGRLSQSSFTYNTSIGILQSRQNFTESSLYILTGRHNITETSLYMNFLTNPSLGLAGIAGLTRAQADASYVYKAGDTITGNLVINSSLSVLGNLVDVKNAINSVYNNLGEPTVEEMALFAGQMNNKMRWVTPDVQEDSANGITWATSTRATTNNLADLMIGDGNTTSFDILPFNASDRGYYRLTWSFKAGGSGYRELNKLYIYCSTEGNNVNFKVEACNNTTGWYEVTNGNTSNWPGHVFIPHNEIWFQSPDSNMSQDGSVRVTFRTVSKNYVTGTNLFSLEWWGGYPAGRRLAESYDRNQKVTFPNDIITSTALVSTIATGLPPLYVSSSTAVSNLNVDYLDGQHGSYYADAASLSTLTGRHNVTETSLGLTNSLALATNSSMGIGFGPYASNASVNTALTNYATNASVNLAFYANVSLGNLSVASVTYNSSIGVITSRHNFTETSLNTLTNRHNTTETSLGLTSSLVSAINTSLGGGLGAYATNASVNLAFYANVSLGSLSAASVVYNTSIGVLTSRHNITETSLGSLTRTLFDASFNALTGRHNVTETSLGITTSLVSALNTSMGSGFGAYATNASVNLAFYANVSLGNLSVASTVYNTSIGTITSRHNFTETSLYTLTGRHNITETSLGLTSSLVSVLNTSMGSGFGAYATNASVNTALGNYATNASVNLAFYANVSLGNLSVASTVYNTSIGVLTSRHNITETSLNTLNNFVLGSINTSIGVLTSRHNFTETSLNTLTNFVVGAINTSIGVLTSRHNFTETSLYTLTNFVGVINTSMGAGFGAYATNASVNTALTNYATNSSVNTGLTAAFASNVSMGSMSQSIVSITNTLDPIDLWWPKANTSLGYLTTGYVDGSINNIRANYIRSSSLNSTQFFWGKTTPGILDVSVVGGAGVSQSYVDSYNLIQDTSIYNINSSLNSVTPIGSYVNSSSYYDASINDIRANYVRSASLNSTQFFWGKTTPGILDVSVVGGAGVSQSYVDSYNLIQDTSIYKINSSLNDVYPLTSYADPSYIMKATYLSNASMGSGFTFNSGTKKWDVSGGSGGGISQDYVDGSFAFKTGFQRISASSNAPSSPSLFDLWIDTSIA